MSLFKKKSSDDSIPQIPSLPILPSPVNFQSKPLTDLPPSAGDARDVSNQEAIKSAIDSSEKISGDSGAVTSPSVNFSSAEINSLPPISLKQTSPPPLPRYDLKKPTFSNSLPPIQEESLPHADFIASQQPIQNNSTLQEEGSMKKEAVDSIFVRIDKFNSAKKDLEEIGRDLKQITNIIEKLNEVKAKEDIEVSGINKTLEDLKERLTKIDSNVFNRL